MIYQFSIILEVEKQLQGGGTAEIPLLSYKKSSHTGSTGNIHGLVLVTDQLSNTGLTQGTLNNIYRFL